MKNEFNEELFKFLKNLEIEITKSNRKRFLFFKDLISDFIFSIEEMKLDYKVEKYLIEEIKLVNELWEKSGSHNKLKLSGVLIGSLSSLFTKALPKSLATIIKEIIDIALLLKVRPLDKPQ